MLVRSVSGVALNKEKRGKNNMIRAIMSGCNGKMGQVITGICKEDAEIEIVAGIDLYDGIKNDYPVFPNISVCDVAADVIIDFSNAKAVDDLLVYSVDKQIPVVLCTTGLSEEQLKKVDGASKKVAVLKSANMSLGINMLMELLKQAATILAPAGFDMEIVEKHHNQKLDAPSGTAITLAEGVIAGLPAKTEWVNYAPGIEHAANRIGSPAEATPRQVVIDSVREGMVPGIHTVTYESEDDILELKHTIKNRRTLAMGAVIAAEFLCGKQGVYSMDDLLK